MASIIVSKEGTFISPLATYICHVLSINLALSTRLAVSVYVCVKLFAPTSPPPLLQHHKQHASLRAELTVKIKVDSWKLGLLKQQIHWFTSNGMH